MKKFTTLGILILALSTISFTAGKNDFCGIKNSAYKEGEVITFKVFYSTLGAYIGAGEATFTTTLERFNGKTVYHHVGEGKTFSFFDNFFKVRDKYESYVDTATLLPYKFVRNIEEGSYKKYNNVTFNQEANTAASTKGVFSITDCMQDVMSSCYYARNIDFNKYKIDDKIPFDMFLDDEIYHLYMRYMGKEKIKTRYGRFNAIKIKPLLVKGTIFEGGEKMTAWISDDPNHIILRVESPISVGSIKVDMMNYRNLRYPLSSFRGLR